MLSITDKRLETGQKEIESLKIRRNTISKSKILSKEYSQHEVALIFLKMLSELTKRLNKYHYQVSRIRIHIQDSSNNSIKFSINLETSTTNFSKLAKLILPIYFSKLKSVTQVTRIGISYEKLTRKTVKDTYLIRKIFYKESYQN